MFDFHLRDICAEVAQPGRALDSTLFVFEGEAEDRVVAGSNPALGTITLLSEKKFYQEIGGFRCFVFGDNPELSLRLVL